MYARALPVWKLFESYTPWTLLHVVPSPPQTRHASSFAVEPSFRSQPTGYTHFLKSIRKSVKLMRSDKGSASYQTLAADADVGALLIVA